MSQQGKARSTKDKIEPTPPPQVPSDHEDSGYDTPKDSHGPGLSSSSSSTGGSGAQPEGQPTAAGIAFSNAQLLQLTQMMTAVCSSILDQRDKASGTIPSASNRVPGSNPELAPTSSSSGSTGVYVSHASSAVGSNASARPAPSHGSRIGSTALSGASYSSVVAPSSSPSIPSAAFVSTTFGLYGNQDKVSATLPALKPLPKNADYDTFEDWRRAAINDMVNTGGMDHVVTKPSDESLALAISTDTVGRPHQAITLLWRTLHLKACSVLKAAFRPALSNTPEVEAEQEQTRDPSAFIVGNANWLWEFASKQFVPDQVGRITKALKALESLRFVPTKMTPSEYNTAFRAAINEIRAAAPHQTFVEEVKLAFYLKGWPADLNQKLDLVKADAQPTVELAQRHLQQWFNDHGKKLRKETSSPPSNPPPSTPTTSPDSTIAALKTAALEARKKLKKAVQRSRDTQNNGGFNTKPQNEESQQGGGRFRRRGEQPPITLGVFTEGKLTTANPYAALNDDDDAAPGVPSASLGAVSPDGREFINTRNEFLLDSGASRNVVYDHSLLKDPQPLRSPIVMNCAMGKATVLQESGSVQLSKRITLKNVCHAKGARLNAMSVSKIADTGYYSVFGKSKAVIIKAEVLEAFIRRVKPADIAFTVPRVGDVYQYTRPGTGPDPNARPKPAFEVNPTGSIPLNGAKPNLTPSSKGGKQARFSDSSSSSSSSARSISGSSASSATTAPRTRAQSSSSSQSSAAPPSSQASLHAMTVAATLREFGLPPDTPVEMSEWYSLTEKVAKSL